MANTYYPDGGKSSVIIGTQPDGLLTSRASMRQIAWAFNSWNVNEEEVSEENASLRASLDPALPEDGILRAEGSAEFPITLEGMMPWIQQFTGTPTPQSIAQPDKTLVPSGTGVAKSVTAVSSGALSGTGAITIADDLSSLEQALTLTVTPSSGTTLSNTNTPGTMTINYTDADGVARTFNLSFPDASKTDAQTRSLPANSQLTSITRTGFSAGTFNLTTTVRRFDDDFFAATGDVTVTAVDGQNLAGTGAKTVIETLGGYTTEETLTVTPDASAALTTSSVDGTINIAYRDANGDAQTITLTFSSSNVTTAQTTTLPAGATITGVTTTGFSAGTFDITASIAANIVRNPRADQPGKLRFQFSAENASGSIVISGKRKAGLKADSTLLQEETMQLSSTGADTTDVKSSKHFYQLTDIKILDSSGDEVLGTGTVEITSQPDGYETLFELGDDIIDPLSVEAELAEIPWRYEAFRVRSAVMNFGNPNNISIDAIAKRVDEERTIEGGDTPQYISTRAAYPTEFPFVTRRIFPSWGGYLEVDGQVLLFSGVTLTFDNGLQFTEGLQGERFSDEVERQTRAISASFNVYFYTGTSGADLYTRWQEKFREREGIDASARIYHFPSTGRLHEVRVDMPNMILSAPVPLNISDRGRVARTIEATAYRSDDATSSDNATITWIGSEQWT